MYSPDGVDPFRRGVLVWSGSVSSNPSEFFLERYFERSAKGDYDYDAVRGLT